MSAPQGGGTPTIGRDRVSEQQRTAYQDVVIGSGSEGFPPEKRVLTQNIIKMRTQHYERIESVLRDIADARGIALIDFVVNHVRVKSTPSWFEDIHEHFSVRTFSYTTGYYVDGIHIFSERYSLADNIASFEIIPIGEMKGGANDRA